MTNKTTLRPATDRDLSHQYGCPASHTVVEFVIYGITHRAIRFWRADMPRETGRIEIYTICPTVADTTFAPTDFLCYADDARCASHVARIAAAMIEAARSGADAAARGVLLEMS